MLDGRVRKVEMIHGKVYDLEHAHGQRGRGEAEPISVEIVADREGVVARSHGREYLIPTALIRAAARIAGKER